MSSVRPTAIIEIPDDEPTDSESGGDAHSRKRKIDLDIVEKVHFTDESDGAPVKPKKRRAKRKSTGRPKKKTVHGEGEEEGRYQDDDEVDLADLPEYLQERRQDFDARRKRLHDAALMLPPDFTGIDLGDYGELDELEERPKFDESSGIKPSRPYDDIELPQSGGFIPASIAQYLRDYQVAGVAFLHRKFVFQEGGILGDDMGLGKTVQVAAFLTAAFGKTGDVRDDKRMRQIRLDSDRWYPRILIVCPGSLLMNWRNEMNRWGWWHIDLFHGANKDDVLYTARAGRLEIMLTTYDTYKNSRSSINMVQWDAVVADECHRLKDRYSETTKAMNEVNALCRIGLTGTAIQNKYEELWTLLDWTNPGHFGTIREWKDSITRPLTIGQSHEATAAQLSLARQTANKLVNNLLPRYFLRRMKSLIADQLPKKTDRVVFCPLTDLQQEGYENFLGSAEIEIVRTVSERCEHNQKKGWCCQKYLPSGKSWQSILFPSIIVLQKLSNHLTLLIPSTTDLEQRHQSELKTLQTCMPEMWDHLYAQRDQIRNLVNPEFCGKWKVLKKLLKFWHSNGDKVLVFSHSVRLLRILQHLFTNTSYSVSYLDGSLSYEQRQDTVDTFNSDPTQFVFLISTKAGGVGLNITSANKVVIVDPHWNPSHDLQAQDRAYRIGQTRDVEVFRLISLGTIEEIVYARQIYKQQQANIGYTASSERRYFVGVQQDTQRRGEIFGLSNIFSYHRDSGLLRDIVNKTNIAEARAGVNLVDVDMEQAAKDEELLGMVKKEDAADNDEGGASQLAAILTAEDQQQLIESRRSAAPKSDAIQAILAATGVEYTHDNSEVIGPSKVEEELSRQAAMASFSEGNSSGQYALFVEPSDEEFDTGDLHGVFRPPEAVQLRQFCEMAREFGFESPTEFALVVESWTQEARRKCLASFYRRRRDKVAAEEAAKEAASAATAEEGETEQKDSVVKSEHGGVVVKMSVEEDGLVKTESETNYMKTETDAGVVKEENKPTIKPEESTSDVKPKIKKDEDSPETKPRIKKEEETDVKHLIKRDEDEVKYSSKEEAIKGETTDLHLVPTKEEDVDAKLDIESDIKAEADVKAEPETKPEDIVKAEFGIKSEAGVKAEPGIKSDTVDVKTESESQREQGLIDMKPFKMEGSSKRTSIFLLSDDDDDEL